MWQQHRDYVRRVLLALAADLDLVEDLLQETYLRARAGVAGYRGDGEQAWLAAIARNTFYSHARRRSYGSEQGLESLADCPDHSFCPDSDHRLTVLAIREALATLPPDLRNALLMKHYGGWDYAEIGKSLSCTSATAKHRVWRAMQRVREAIGAAEDHGAHCCELRGAKILDWLYGGLSNREQASVERHIALCASCRKSMTEIKTVSTLLEDCQGDRRLFTFIDLDEQGRTTRYVWAKLINDTPGPMETFHWQSRTGWTIESLALQDEPVSIRWVDGKGCSGFHRFEGDLPNPVPPGGMADATFVACPPADSHWEPQPVGDGQWHYHHRHSPFPRDGGFFVCTIRLPAGARLVKVTPEPRDMTTRAERISMNWQVMTDAIPPDWLERCDRPWQFEAHIDYSLSSRD